VTRLSRDRDVPPGAILVMDVIEQVPSTADDS
jgi:hypothetical protein